MTDDDLARRLRLAYAGELPPPLDALQHWLDVLAEARRILGVTPEAQAVLDYAVTLFPKRHLTGSIASIKDPTRCAPDVPFDDLFKLVNLVCDYKDSLRPPEPPPRFSLCGRGPSTGATSWYITDGSGFELPCFGREHGENLLGLMNAAEREGKR